MSSIRHLRPERSSSTLSTPVDCPSPRMKFFYRFIPLSLAASSLSSFAAQGKDIRRRTLGVRSNSTEPSVLLGSFDRENAAFSLDSPLSCESAISCQSTLTRKMIQRVAGDCQPRPSETKHWNLHLRFSLVALSDQTEAWEKVRQGRISRGYNSFAICAPPSSF